MPSLLAPPGSARTAGTMPLKLGSVSAPAQADRLVFEVATISGAHLRWGGETQHWLQHLPASEGPLLGLRLDPCPHNRPSWPAPEPLGSQVPGASSPLLVARDGAQAPAAVSRLHVPKARTLTEMGSVLLTPTTPAISRPRALWGWRGRRASLLGAWCCGLGTDIHTQGSPPSSTHLWSWAGQEPGQHWLTLLGGDTPVQDAGETSQRLAPVPWPTAPSHPQTSQAQPQAPCHLPRHHLWAILSGHGAGRGSWLLSPVKFFSAQ